MLDKLRLGAASAFIKARRAFKGGTTMSAPAAPAGTIYTFEAKDIDGKPKKLSEYKGKVLLVVNVASMCGFTPQYAGLEELNKKYKARGLAVLGFPANEFGAQEPGSDADIKQFCRMKYSIGFDLFSKIVVKGAGIHPLYKFLTTRSGHDGEIQWNFEKFLVAKDGSVIARFPSDTAPEKLAARIEALL
jgi:glutathione peroxidase